jgi:hypothetical protein
MDSASDSEDELMFLGLAYMYHRQNIRRRRRRWWVHPILRERTQFGEFHHLVRELQLDSQRYQQYFRVSSDQFEEILSRIGPHIH